ncbi:MAG: hypothetical protein ACPL5F_14540 [Moorellaceae bacterium]
MKIRKHFIIAIVTAMVLMALIIPGMAMAQNQAPDSGQQREELFQSFVEKLADNLGIDADELLAAVKETALDMVNEAVDEGKLDADQAEKMKEAIEEGKFPPFGPMGGSPGGPGGKHLEDMAQILGMTTDELKTQMEKGKKLEDLAQEKGLTQEQLREKMMELRIQEIQQAVKDGKLSQDKADEMIERMKNAPQGGELGFGPPPGPAPESNQSN